VFSCSIVSFIRFSKNGYSIKTKNKHYLLLLVDIVGKNKNMGNPKISEQPFRFKQFKIYQDKCLMKVGTDGILLGAWADVAGAQEMLDIGTGTGVIAIMLAQRSEEARIDGVEIDQYSYEQAVQNVTDCPWNTRINVVHESIQNYAKQLPKQYDLIVSNPPFFSGGTFSSSQDRTSVRHTVKLPHGDLLRSVRQLLDSEGRFAVVLPLIEGLRFEEMARTYKLFCTRKKAVRPKADKPVERLLMLFEKVEKPIIEEPELVIQYDGRNNWTEDYIDLTKAFYLKM
jgi:tRNA1Val (adenine37-N6)-methyltransferase